jgi:ribonuclease HI
MNLDLLQEIDEAIAGRRYRFEWVKGHVGHVLNEAADTRARAAAEAYQRGLEVPTGPGFGGDAPVVRERVSAPARASVPPLDTVLPDEPRSPVGVATLFDLDEQEPEEERLRELTLQLTEEEYARLLLRARAVGSSPEDLLRRLI